MAEKVTARFNRDVKEELQDAINHRENPRLISLMKHLIRLTNSPDENAVLYAEEKRAPECDHENINRKSGKCLDCGEVVTE